MTSIIYGLQTDRAKMKRGRDITPEGEIALGSSIREELHGKEFEQQKKYVPKDLRLEN